MKPWTWDMDTTAAALSAREVSASELVTLMFHRIEKYDPLLSAFISKDVEGALERAKTVDELRENGSDLPYFAGIPICVKDLFDIAGMPSTYGGKHYGAHVPDQTATAVKRLTDAGFIVLGKTNLHEYAYGTTTENPHYGNAHNPWNRGKISGGSSGGTSVAVTAGLALAGLGTDTGGSIRIPAALTGHVGFKPTYGLVSKHGVFPLAESLDHVGPMTRTVRDAAHMLQVMAGYDPKDAGAARYLPPNYELHPDVSRRPLSALRIGVPKQFFFDKCHASVLQVISGAIRRLEEEGATLVEVEVPHIHDVPHNQTVIISSEALDTHRTRNLDMSLYGEDVRRRLDAGHSVSGADLVAAYRFQRAFRQGLYSLFQQPVDVLVTPTTPLTATDIGQFKAHIKAQEVGVRAHLTRYTNPWNLSGLPAISLPCGMASDGLPVGLQLIGPAFSDKKLLQIAREVEAVFDWDPIAPDYR